MPLLPRELTDAIFYYLRSDSASLKQCGLVCTSWVASSRVLLFETVILDNCNVDDFTWLVISPRSTIPPFVRSLELSPRIMDGRWLRRLIPFLQVLSTTTLLKLYNVDWCALHASSRATFISTFAPTLSNLQLRNVEFGRFDDLLDVITSFPVLEQLSIDEVSFDSGHYSPAKNDGRRLPSSLTHLHFGVQDNGVILKWILSHDPIPIIQHINISTLRLADAFILGTYFRHLGARLRSLKVAFRDTESVYDCCLTAARVYISKVIVTHSVVSGNLVPTQHEVQSPIVTCNILSVLTGLQLVHIDRFIYYSDRQNSSATNWAVRTLVSLKSLHLEKLVLGIYLSRVGELDGHLVNWEFLDQVLRGDMFANLKALIFRMEGTVNKAGLADLISVRLPSCQARGILHFE